MVRYAAQVALATAALGLWFAQSSQAQKIAVTGASFPCMTQGTKVRNTVISHRDPARLKEAVRIFQTNAPDVEYPVGTIVQLVPGEAMVKQPREEFPNSNGWEFFALDITPQGTKITARGDKAANPGGTCVGCHTPAKKFDYVCGRTHGCASIPLTDELIAKLQASDARCGSPVR